MAKQAKQMLLVGCSGSSAASEGRELAAGAEVYSDGILTFELSASGKLGSLRQFTPWPAASFAALDPDRQRLFVLSQQRGDQQSRLGSFAYDEHGEIEALGDASVDGLEACHLCVDPTGQYVASAHFSSASIAVNPVASDGIPGRARLHQVTGSGPHRRQDVPHPHMILASPDGQWIVTADMGTDEVASYVIDPAAGKLVPKQSPAAKVQPGGGARHFVFHRSGKVFVCNELDSSVTSMTFDSETGTLSYLGHTTTLLDGSLAGDAQCGAIRLSPDERFLYVANRARETIAIFEVDADGQLRPIGERPCSGAGARDMFVTEAAVYIAFATADKVCVFSRDAVTGDIGRNIQTVVVPQPMFVLPLSI